MTFALVAALTIASLSLIGSLFLGKEVSPRTFHRVLLPGAVGVFLGVVFFELIPETLEASELGGAVAILAGFLGFYLLTHLLLTYHHHHGDEHDECEKGGARKLLVGDAVHNLSDGIVIGTSFLINPAVGIVTTIGIALHEIPQEIAEYAILRGAGYSMKRALTLNFLTASTVVLGVLFTYLLGDALHEYIFILTGVAAGNLLYIATADLIPELRTSHTEHFKSIFISTILGVLLIGATITYAHERFGHDYEAEHGEEHEAHEGA